MNKTPIHELDIQTRTYNGLRRAGYKTVFDLQEVTVRDLGRIDNFGGGSVKDLRIALEPYGTIIHDDPNPLKISEVIREMRRGARTPSELVKATGCTHRQATEALTLCNVHGSVAA